MPLTRFEITSRVPYAGDRRFGAVGAYEQVDGTAHFAVDPIHPANARICDLKLAPRNGPGWSSSRPIYPSCCRWMPDRRTAAASSNCRTAAAAASSP